MELTDFPIKTMDSNYGLIPIAFKLISQYFKRTSKSKCTIIQNKYYYKVGQSFVTTLKMKVKVHRNMKLIH